MSPQNTPESPKFHAAMGLAHEGKRVEAETLLARATQEAEGKFGAGSPQADAAYSELGTLLVAVGQWERAADALRNATRGPEPTDPQHRRDRLTSLMNLGEILQQTEELEEAETVLRRGVEGRKSYYGAEHPGTAFGLEPLAAVLMLQGRYPEARQTIDAAASIFWRNVHPRVATAAALRAEIIAASGDATPPFANLDALTNERIAGIAEHVVMRAQTGMQPDPKVSRRVLGDLYPLVFKRLGEGHPQTLNVLAMIAELERGLGGHAARQEAIRRTVAIFERNGRPADAVNALLGLALAQSEANQLDDARATYIDAASRAELLDAPALTSQALRNFGLFLAEIGEREEAETKLRAAVSEGERSDDPETLGRAEIALGIFLQHSGRLDAARPLLERAVDRLEPMEPDALTARSHLNAILNNRSCGCGDMAATFEETFRRLVLSQLPPDLLEDIRFGEGGDGESGLQVHLKREATPEEAEQLQRVIHYALADLRRNLRQ